MRIPHHNHDTIDLDLLNITTPTAPPDLSSFYTDISPLVAARIIACTHDLDQLTGLDRLVVSLRVLEGRPGRRCWDSIDLTGLDGAHLLSFLRACGLPPEATSVELRPRGFEGRVVGLRFTEERPIGAEDLAQESGVPLWNDQPALFVVSGSYEPIEFEE